MKNSEILKPFKSYQVSASLRTGNAFNVQSMNLDHQTKIFKIKFSLYTNYWRLSETLVKITAAPWILTIVEQGPVKIEKTGKPVKITSISNQEVKFWQGTRVTVENDKKASNSINQISIYPFRFHQVTESKKYYSIPINVLLTFDLN